MRLPIALSLIVLIAAVFQSTPIRDATMLSGVTDVHLDRPDTYVVFAPFSDVLDTITLLSERQHFAILLGLVALWGLWQLARARGMRPELRASARSLVALLASMAITYVAAAYLPRPMAYLASVDPDVVRVDFHSHTLSSKDARQSYTPERNRAWHHAGGYDVAYVTDHHTFAGADRGLANDPRTGKDGVMLLRGKESNWVGEHIGVLGGCCGNDAPIVVWNHPRDPELKRLPLASGAVQAIEISNGAIQGMDLVRRKRQKILSLARKEDLALLSGTDSHGWGYAAPNWTLLRIQGWRDLGRDALATQIEQTIRAEGFGATQVIERATADPGTSTTALALSVFIVPWNMLTELSPAERGMWLVWIWLIAGAELLRRRRLAPRPATVGPVPLS